MLFFNAKFDNSTNLNLILEEVFNIVLKEKYSISKKSGLTTLSSAIPPDFYQTAKLKLDFDESGKVKKSLFFGKKIFDDLQNSQIEKTLNQIAFLPALKNGKPVNLVLYFYVNKV